MTTDTTSIESELSIEEQQWREEILRDYAVVQSAQYGKDTLTLDTNMYVELVQSNATDEMIARAAWVSNVGEESKTKDASEIQGLINFLWRNQHHSPFEHGQYTFFIKCPLFVAREFQRHRTFSFNEVSGRYSEMKPHFYLLSHDRPVVQKGKIGNYDFADNFELANYARTAQHFPVAISWNSYLDQKDAGIANEVARDILPLSLYTSFYATVNPRNLAHFLDLRTDKQALKEIRDVGDRMESIFADQQPLFYNAWKRYRPLYLDTDTQEIVSKEELEELRDYKFRYESVDK